MEDSYRASFVRSFKKQIDDVIPGEEIETFPPTLEELEEKASDDSNGENDDENEKQPIKKKTAAEEEFIYKIFFKENDIKHDFFNYI